MIVLVLDDAGGITAVLLVVLDEILIHITDFNTGRTHHVLVDPGQAQTPFAETPFVTEAFVNLGVDKSFLEIGQFGLFLGQGEASTTNMRMLLPTCGAASPTPSASYIVSHMSAMNCCRPG